MADTKTTQIFIKLLDNKTITLQIPTQITNPIDSIKHQIQTLTQIPISLQTLTLNGRLLNPTTTAAATTTTLPNFSTLTLTLPLHGGKGGFGSLLRGAATKAGQKKTNNFDACRDMSGRRLRHVNAEKKLEEWRAEEEERKLEKMADKYLKEVAKKKGQIGKREEKIEKYIKKYREESQRCAEEVERSVREAAAAVLAGRKRKGVEKKKSDEIDAKKLKIWMGKRKLGESDSDDSDGDTESDNSDSEKEKSVVIDNGSQSDSSKDSATASVSASRMDGDQIAGGSSDSGSEEEKDSVAVGSDAPSSVSNGQSNWDSPFQTSSEIEGSVSEKQSVSAEVTPVSAEIVSDQLPSTSTLREPNDTQLMATDTEVQRDSGCQPTSVEEGNSNAVEVLQPLNFDDFNSAAELETLGMERLKDELQERGLKCGGTLQERAARLYLLKTTPLEKLPRKLFAKK